MTLSLDQIGIIVGAILTLLILSYLIGDNFLFRLAVHILVGVGAAYAAVVVIFDVILPRLVQPLLDRVDPVAMIIAVAALVLSVMLLFKISPRLAWIGNLPVGYIVGVGAAVALGGALFGTLGPQITATAAPAGGLMAGPDASGTYNFILNVIIFLGTLTTLLSFGFYRVTRSGLLSGVHAVGRQFFLMIALGATFALVFMASVTLLIARIEAISDAIKIFTK